MNAILPSFHGDVIARDLFLCIKDPRHIPSTTKRRKFTSYRGADKSLALPTSRCILFNGENISFDASLVIYINSTNTPPIMFINRIYEHQHLLLL
jgi:hypothetical protein